MIHLRSNFTSLCSVSQSKQTFIKLFASNQKPFFNWLSDITSLLINIAKFLLNFDGLKDVAWHLNRQKS
jgi:hypothetical protein